MVINSSLGTHEEIAEAKPLNEIAEFDSPFRVHADGTITDVHYEYAPSLQDDRLDSDRWELLNGYSGQDRYSGPIMHNSEYIGGQLERDILETPGVYVVVVSQYLNVCDTCGEEVTVIGGDTEPERMTHVYGTDDDYDHEATDDETYLEGWAVARLKVS